jgi:Bacterial Ig-like domain
MKIIHVITIGLSTTTLLTACPFTQMGAKPLPPPDTTPSNIVSITPGNGAIGISKDVKITLKFSETMNKTSTELAYQSTDMPSVQFSWSENDTMLEIDPAGDLNYTLSGKEYSFSLGAAATDLAGNALTPIASTFRTFKELNTTLKSDATRDGWVRSDNEFDSTATRLYIGDSTLVDNAQYKSYLSFDLSSLEATGLTTSDRLTSARLRLFQGDAPDGSPYTNLALNGKKLIATHVSYGSSLGGSDFNTSVLGEFGTTIDDADIEWKEYLNGLSFVQNDWDNREARGKRSQYMLYFPKATDGDGSADVARFNAGNNASNQPELRITYLVP